MPTPDVMSIVSDTNRISVAESSRKPSSDEISPSVVQPISAIPGKRAHDLRQQRLVIEVDRRKQQAGARGRAVQSGSTLFEDLRDGSVGVRLFTVPDKRCKHLAPHGAPGEQLVRPGLSKTCASRVGTT